MSNHLTAVICAAGVGKRLLPLTEKYPKPLLTVGEKTILEHQLDALASNKIAKIIIIVGHGADEVKKKVDKRYQNCAITYIFNNEYANTNNIYSLWLARREITDGMIFLNGDVIFNSRIIRRIMVDKNVDSIAVDRNCELLDDAIKTRFEGENLLEIGKKIKGRPDGWAFGIYKLSQTTSEKYFSIAGQLFAFDQRNKNISFVVPLQKMVSEVAIKGTGIDGLPWIEIDTHEDYKEAQKKIHSIISAKAEQT